MNFKVKSVKMKIIDKGVVELLKGKDLEKAMLEYCKQLATEFEEIMPAASYEEKGADGWDTKILERAKRITGLVYTDNESIKWREAATGELAKHMKSKARSGKPKMPKVVGGLDF